MCEYVILFACWLHLTVNAVQSGGLSPPKRSVSGALSSDYFVAVESGTAVLKFGVPS